MQHISINDANGCTILNIDAQGGRPTPSAAHSRQCPQCEMDTWRHTPVCMHCGHDRFGKVRLIAKSGAAAALAALVIFYPLIRG